MRFKDIIPLQDQIYENLSNIDINKPSAIQEGVFCHVLAGQDLIAVSPTGTGKTLAYLLPVFSMLKSDISKPQAVILAPTHELAAQIKRETDIMANGTDIKSSLIIGGANLQRQLTALKEKPQVIIGAAGRINELYSMKKLTLHFVRTIVVDEADRMLNEKNIKQTKAVINATLKDRQLLFFSASMDNTTTETAQNLSKNAVVVNISKMSGKGTLPDNIEHIYFECDKRDRVETLRKIIHALGILTSPAKPCESCARFSQGNKKKAIIFSGNQNEAENISSRLNYHEIKTVSLCGQNLKEERRLALDSFRKGNVNVLSATDLAARGLDIKGEIYVFCIGVSSDSYVYLHRAGRTGRMNKKGTAITIVAPDEVYRLKRIEKSLGIKISKREISNGKIK